MALREELAEFESDGVPYVDTTNWTDVRMSALEAVEDAAAVLIRKVKSLQDEKNLLEASLRQARQREQKLIQENSQMRKDIAYALERVERALDALATGIA